MTELRSTAPDHRVPSLQVFGVTGIPEIAAGDQLGEMVLDASARQDTPIEDGDILVVTQKIVSKAEGRLVRLRDVTPSPFAERVGHASGKDPRLIEVVLGESRAIVRMDLDRGVLITETRHGFVCANAGVDRSNVAGEDTACLLPEDPDRSARGIQADVEELLPRGRVGVIISDTFGRAWREGQVNFAIGVSGMEPFADYRGAEDSFGNILRVTRIAIADELASTAELVMGKTDGVPVAIVRGYRYVPSAGGVDTLLRDRSTDLFR